MAEVFTSEENTEVRNPHSFLDDDEELDEISAVSYHGSLHSIVQTVITTTNLGYFSEEILEKAHS